MDADGICMRFNHSIWRKLHYHAHFMLVIVFQNKMKLNFQAKNFYHELPQLKKFTFAPCLIKIFTTWIYLKNSGKTKVKSENGWTRFMDILPFRNWREN